MYDLDELPGRGPAAAAAAPVPRGPAPPRPFTPNPNYEYLRGQGRHDARNIDDFNTAVRNLGLHLDPAERARFPELYRITTFEERHFYEQDTNPVGMYFILRNRAAFDNLFARALDYDERHNTNLAEVLTQYANIARNRQRTHVRALSAYVAPRL